MRKNFNKKLDKFRFCPPGLPQYFSDPSYGPNGFFLVRWTKDDKSTVYLNVMSSSGDDMYPWEHVSVTVREEKRCPTWDEMCYIKSLFWDEQECVVQYHPAKRNYVNAHNYCLHLWKSLRVEFPVPPPETVGPLNPNEGGDTTVDNVPKEQRFTDDQASMLIDAYVDAHRTRVPLPGEF